MSKWGAEQIHLLHTALVAPPDEVYSGTSLVAPPDEVYSGTSLVAPPDEVYSGTSLVAPPDEVYSGTSLVGNTVKALAAMQEDIYECSESF
jgi:hypothetical protein